MKNILILVLCSFCLCVAQTQKEISDAQGEYKKLDKELNDAYQSILFGYQSDTLFINNLKKSQRIWIQLRDAELAMRYPEINKDYSGVNPVCVASYLAGLTFDRIQTLRVWLDGIDDSSECLGSVKQRDGLSFNIPHIKYYFDGDSARWVKIPAKLEHSEEVVLEEGQNIKNGKMQVIRFDLNEDKIPEYFIIKGCGNGGCGYTIYDGKTYSLLGEIFGDPVLISEGKRFGYYLIMTYSHQSANSGNWTVYEFNGRKYQVTRSMLLKGDDVESLFEMINGASKSK